MQLITEKLKHWQEFDYVVICENPEDASEKIRRIISGERLKRFRNQQGLQSFVDDLMQEAESTK